jgi:hypothetical protein
MEKLIKMCDILAWIFVFVIPILISSKIFLQWYYDNHSADKYYDALMGIKKNFLKNIGWYWISLLVIIVYLVS